MSSYNSSNLIPAVPGDIVKLNMNNAHIKGIVVDSTCETGWLDVLLENGFVTKWPASALQVLVPCRDLRD